jgi:ribosome-associated heat shock protein Hsp15
VDAPAEKIRIDKWLWHARFFKTRSLSAKVVSGGGCRVNGTPVAKPAVSVKPGDVLTFPQGRDVRVVKIIAVGSRRGPAPEAQGLYDDLVPPEPKTPDLSSPKVEGKGRPSKKDRRVFEKSRSRALE